MPGTGLDSGLLVMSSGDTAEWAIGSVGPGEAEGRHDRRDARPSVHALSISRSVSYLIRP